MVSNLFQFLFHGSQLGHECIMRNLVKCSLKIQPIQNMFTEFSQFFTKVTFSESFRKLFKHDLPCLNLFAVVNQNVSLCVHVSSPPHPITKDHFEIYSYITLVSWCTSCLTVFLSFSNIFKVVIPLFVTQYAVIFLHVFRKIRKPSIATSVLAVSYWLCHGNILSQEKKCQTFLPNIHL